MPDFPPDFLWGISTSAYQIEGASTVGGKGESIWDRFTSRPGVIADGSTGAVATGHYELYEKDVALMRELGARVYRFSVAWSRWLPRGSGAAAKAGVGFYERLVDALLAAGIEPWVCLYHWDLPQVLQERGGWAWRDCAYYFADYAERVAERLGDRVNSFLMLNEPNVHALLGYLTGTHAPGVSDLGSYLAAVHHQNLAVSLGIERLRSLDPHWRLGTVVSLQPVSAGWPTGARAPREEDVAAAALADAAYNRANLDPLLLGTYPAPVAGFFEHLVREGEPATLRQPIDLLGINHYTSQRVRAGSGPLGLELMPVPTGTPATLMGWAVAPDALRDTLVRLRDEYGNPPVVVTENGAAYRDVPTAGGVVDHERRSYFERYLTATLGAIAEGCDVRGYLAWTLVDNFEWADGFTRPFGVVSLDRRTLARTPKASFDYLQGVFAGGPL